MKRMNHFIDLPKKYKMSLIVLVIVGFLIFQHFLVLAVNSLIIDAMNHLDQLVAGFMQGWVNS